MKTVLMLMALLGASAYGAQPSDKTMHDDTHVAADTPIEHACDCLGTDACEETSTMRLSVLNPKWITGDPSREGLGVIFDCPCDHCEGAIAEARQRVAIFFDTPLDGLPQLASAPKTWHREGSTFEDLTLSPSIRFMAHDPRVPGAELVEHWHGFVRAGAVTS